MLLEITLLSVLSLVLFAVSDYAIGRSGRSLNPHIVNFMIQAMSFVTVVPILAWFGVSMPFMDALVCFVIGIAFGFGFYYYVTAMARGPMGVAAPIVNAYAVVTLVMGLLFFGVRLSTQAIVALALVAAGAVLLTFSKDLLKGKMLHSTTTRLAVISMLIQGVSFAFLTPSIERNEWYEVLFFMSLGTFVTTTVIMLNRFHKKRSELRVLFTNKIMVALAGGLMTGLGAVALFSAGGLGKNIILPGVLSAASPLVTSIIAYYLDGERLSLINRAGAVVIVMGMVLLNV